jgi:hypothetical protein
MKTMASDVLNGVPKVATYEETIGALKGRFGNQHLVALYHTQLKTRTQIDGEPLHQFAITMKLAHHAFPALHKDHVLRGAGKACTDDIREKKHETETTSGRQENGQ